MGGKYGLTPLPPPCTAGVLPAGVGLVCSGRCGGERLVALKCAYIHRVYTSSPVRGHLEVLLLACSLFVPSEGL